MEMTPGNKIVLVGTGAVGTSYAYALMNQGLSNELVLVDINEDKAQGEVMDLSHGIVYAPSAMNITQGTYADCKDAAIVVICAGVAQKEGETRLDLVNKNVAIFKSMVKSIMDAGFNGIFIVATNPVDILSYATWKFSQLPKERVIGSGTVLDSARFRFLLGQKFATAPASVHGYIIGEHGDSQLPVWSTANISGTSIAEKISVEEKAQIAEQVRNAAYEIISMKGATYYAIGMGLARITKAILNNEHIILPVGTLLTGEHGHKDVYVGVPSIIHRTGVKGVADFPLDETEQRKFASSIAILKDIQNQALL
ncbi:L-lactate dehydrogenase [Virgibacillus dokdonensis]|uniref:L-lactate dehydrogenase n=1 Tax=Virgibacillus dokdonensis TaxID=302167 RepID=A0A3E0WUT4_9BACI|nr:L-lactate dehydrogenase [Virgibacillus dokdonensis]RFA36752.1 L-lactate dehydrogenase [Virgibacillus dokdonensis]